MYGAQNKNNILIKEEGLHDASNISRGASGINVQHQNVSYRNTGGIQNDNSELKSRNYQV